MKITNIPLDLFTLKNAKIDSDGNYVFNASGGELSLVCETGKIGAFDIAPTDYIVMDVTCLSGSSCCIVWDFVDTDDGKGGCGIKQGILPAVKTRLALPYEASEGKQLFLPRTPGKLKTVVHGRPIKLDELKLFKIRADAAPHEVVLKIDSVAIYDAVPDFPLEAMDLVDDLGQKNIGDWQGRTKSAVEMAKNLRTEIMQKDAASVAERSKFGGWTGKRFDEGTGFFRLEQTAERWWMADPEGYAFFSMGLDCINIDGDCNLEGIECLCRNLPERGTPGWSERRGGNSFSWHKYNLYRAFGEYYHQDWMDLTKNRMNRWGFNTVACWSEIEFARYAKIPYTYIFSGYPRTEHYIFRDFPDVFSDEYQASSEKWAQQIESFKDDPYLIGYFMANEPTWAFVDGLNIAKMTLASEKPLESRKVLATFMQNVYFDIDFLNAAWGSDYESFDDMADNPSDASNFNENAEGALMAFSEEMVREYIKAPSLAIKAIDKNHLNLGIRYAWLSSKALAAGSEYTDIFSFNCYSLDPYSSIERITDLVNKPVIIGEYHFGALDRGLDATGIRGVTTQAERAVAYKYYMHRAASHPMCLGAHYFQLNDQGYLGRFDGENYQIGIVDVCNKPYEEFVDGIRETNEELYKVVSGQEYPTETQANSINPIFF